MDGTPTTMWPRHRVGLLSNSLDRFIPSRRNLNFDLAYKHLFETSTSQSHVEDTLQSPGDFTNAPVNHTPDHTPTLPMPGSCSDSSMDEHELKVYRKRLSIAMDQRPLKRVLSFSASPCKGSPVPLTSGPFNANQVHVSPIGAGISPVSSHRRRLPRDPDKVLALPNIRDDFYTNTMDWSCSNCLAIGLGNLTHIWNASTYMTEVVESVSLEPRGGREELFVSSVKWSTDGVILAIANSQGVLLLYDTSRKQEVWPPSSIARKQIGCMDWCHSMLYCGSRDGYIHVIDTSLSMDQQFTLRAKRRFEITSLQVSPDKTLLASGSDDGYIRLWCIRSRAMLHEIDAHMSSIKALAWCPWRSDLLASGGGCNDGRILLWNRNTGRAVFEQETQMQTCSIVWSPDYKELITSHGFPSNDILVWSVHDTALTQEGVLQLHQGRPLHLSLSPDRTTLASAGADEALCLWKLFPIQKEKKVASGPLDLFSLR